MNAPSTHPATLSGMARSLWSNRTLVRRLAVREVVGRYRGSFLGLAWSFFHPLLMLLIYTVVFTMVFDAKWNEPESGLAGFSLVLFVGMILHGFFSECIVRAPSIVSANVNYVKKVVFPLEILPVVSLVSALFHACASLIVLLAMFLFLHGLPPITALGVPVLLLPLVFYSLGAGWFLASMGVYVRDVGQMATVLATVLLFLSPVFYPIQAVPEELQWILRINPLAISIEHVRGAFLWGRWPGLRPLGLQTLLGLVTAWAGFAWFQTTRQGFADVL